MKQLFRITVLTFSLVLICFSANAQKASELPVESVLTDTTQMPGVEMLYDGDITTALGCSAGSSLSFYNEAGIGSAYLIFDLEPEAYTLTNLDTMESVSCGENGFLHEYIDMEERFGTLPSSVRITFNSQVRLCELKIYSSGEPADDVQIWHPAKPGKADMLLFSTHGDDEQLFFAGILPYYAGELQYEVVVCYFTSHRPIVYHRTHEMLDGLYAVGVRTYPVFGPFPDYHSLSLEKSYSVYKKNGYYKEQMLAYVVEQLRKFKPIVAVGHDVEGEYGHGAHRMYSELLREGVELAAREDMYSDSRDEWGIWDTPKTYLHLYDSNPIVMDWDKPLDSFDGMTAYEVTKFRGFAAHKSQYDDYWWYFDGNETAADCESYSPCEFGLYRSLVGADVTKNDFFENKMGYTQELREADLLAQRVLQELEEESRREELVRQETQPDVAVPQEQASSANPAVIAAGCGIISFVLLLAMLILKKDG